MLKAEAGGLQTGHQQMKHWKNFLILQKTVVLPGFGRVESPVWILLSGRLFTEKEALDKALEVARRSRNALIHGMIL